MNSKKVKIQVNAMQATKLRKLLIYSTTKEFRYYKIN